MAKYRMSSDLRQALISSCRFPAKHSRAIRSRLRKALLQVPDSLELEATMVVEPDPKRPYEPVFLLTWECRHPERRVREIVNGHIGAKSLFNIPVKPKVPFVKIPQPGSPIAAEFVTLEEYYEQRNQAILEVLQRFDQVTIYQPKPIPTG